MLTATLAFGAAAFAVLAALALVTGDHGITVAALVYGGSLVACALCSFLYQMLESSEVAGAAGYLDDSAIFLLIAGTYTPFAAAGIHGPFHGSLLAWVWGLALIGIVLKLVLPRAHDRAFVLVYLALGWIFVTSADEVMRASRRCRWRFWRWAASPIPWAPSSSPATSAAGPTRSGTAACWRGSSPTFSR